MMQTLLMMTLMMNSYFFTQMKHPMSLGLILLIQTLLTCMYTGSMSKTFWMSYILFLIFIGGMLILFMYMASLSPNMLLNFSSNKMFFISLMFLMMIYLLIMDKFIMLDMKNNYDSLSTKKFNLIYSNTLMLSKMYNYPNNFLTILMISYLLLTLIVIVKISNSFMGPLRKKN